MVSGADRGRKNGCRSSRHLSGAAETREHTKAKQSAQQLGLRAMGAKRATIDLTRSDLK